jgi:hypothetical protein
VSGVTANRGSVSGVTANRGSVSGVTANRGSVSGVTANNGVAWFGKPSRQQTPPDAAAASQFLGRVTGRQQGVASGCSDRKYQRSMS